METLLRVILVLLPVVGALVTVYIGAGEVAALRRETGDRSVFLRFLSLGRRDDRSSDEMRHHHREIAG